jgi:CDP-diacylglycerol--glycerol-3-phosphate 3-phosphatidyltransferase
MVSYVRAKAEGLGIECKVGLLTRFERFLVITAGLLLDKVLIALWVLAVLSNFTALQRLYHVWRMTRSDEG